MNPFLYSIAEAYLDNESAELIDYCFVFPSKRSAIYFNDYLTTICREKSIYCIPPATTTIVEFLDSFNDTVAGDRMEMIFILYGVYRNVVKEYHGEKEAATIDFNRFVYWADVLLNDFDDVDNSMADVASVFKNIKELKEISANYLTPEQIDIIKKFWNEESVPQEIKDFWNHIAYEHKKTDNDEKESLATVGFLKLWQVMHQVYTRFQEKLRNLGLHTAGMACRTAVSKLKETGAGTLAFKRYIFVGFNNLSKAEHTLFAIFRDMRNGDGETSMGDFYWDTASPAFKNTNLAGGQRVIKFARDFPSHYDCIKQTDTFPKIDIIGIPSRVGQSKTMSKILDSMFVKTENNEKEFMADLRNTAIILPEENMLHPLLTSLPEKISPINITMGYKLRNTAVAGLIRNIISMQMNAYQSPVENTFYHVDVTNVLSHPLMRIYKPALCSSIIHQIQQTRMFNVPETLFKEKYSELVPIFTLVANKDKTVDTFTYLENLLDWLQKAVKSTLPEDATDNEADGQDDDNAGLSYDSEPVAPKGKNRNTYIQLAFLQRYTNALARLRTYCNTYISKIGDVYLENSTVFSLTERLVQGEMLNFEGMPLRGLQIMGVLESRTLDFETLILPSMNERIFPRSRFTPSFIPPVLRSAYGLPTPEEQENVFTYLFYRMITRCKRVFMLYDARSSGLKNSQPSRYIQQLTHIFKPEGLNTTVLPYTLKSIENPILEIEKNPEVMAEINRFRKTDIPNPRYLSASSIELYIRCPMSFYLEKIANYRREDDINEWVDEGTYGTIVHDVLEKLYNSFLNGHEDNGAIIKSSDLQNLIDNKAIIQKAISRSFNEFYLKKGNNCYDKLNGDIKILGIVIENYIINVLKKELAYTPFTYLNSEWNKTGVLTLAHTDPDDNSTKSIDINFTCKIDRIDKHANTLRIIDYKTGSDDTAFTLDGIFTDHKQKVLLQLMLYSQAYAQFNNYPEKIQPMVYKLRDIMIGDIEPLKWKKREEGNRQYITTDIDDYRTYVNDINGKVIAYLEELFDENTPFRCADNKDACKFCAFTSLCNHDKKSF